MRVERILKPLLVVVALAVVWAQSDKDTAFIGNRGRNWMFQKVERPAIPPVGSGWVRTPIDAFIFKGLEEKQTSPSPAMDRRALIRRVSLYLTGLPPSPADVDAFLRDKSADAYEKVVNRLLA